MNHSRLSLRAAAAFTALLLLFTVLITGCGEQEKPASSADGGYTFGENSSAEYADYYSLFKENSDMLQFETPKDTDEIAVLKTNMGNIALRFFPEQAPLAVENFLTHAKEGYYNGVTFHRVIKDFMIQGGDPAGTGAGGEPIAKFGDAFRDEFSEELFNFRGALSMANAGYSTNGSQFFIVQNPNGIGREERETYLMNAFMNAKVAEATYRIYDAEEEGKSQEEIMKMVEEENAALQKLQEKGADKDFEKKYNEALDKYEELGGTPHLDHKHTVFGQVIDGMEIVDKIAAVKVDVSSKPVKDVVINGIDVMSFADYKAK